MTISVSIVGKPNVGKSTFFNKIFNKEISKTGDEPGTTRQVISYALSAQGRNIIFYDTGGLKKKSKSKEIEQAYITKECLSAINKSSIIIFMMNANDNFTKNDKQICRMILNKLKTLIVIINKSDLLSKDELKIKTKYFNYYFENLYSDILIKPYFFSSIGKTNVNEFIKIIIKLDNLSKFFINNHKLNIFLEKTNNSHRAPQEGLFRPKIKYLRHVNLNPYILKAFGTRLKKINKNYKNYFLKQFLRTFNIFNKVVIIKFINNENPFKKS